MADNNALAKLDTATRMLAEVRTIDEAKDIIDLAEAARVYARQVDLGLEAQNHAAEIKLRAQRRAGDILDQMEKNKGGRPIDTENNLLLPVIGYENKEPPTLTELGITGKDAHVWQTLAKMPEQDFEETIAETKAEGKELSTAGLYRTAKREENYQTKETQPIPEGKYTVIYADPPWEYDNSGFDQSAAAIYPTMHIEDICSLPIGDLAAEPCVLFLWATSPLLPEAFRVITAWGFEYKASRVWVKDKAPGIGWWINTRHEMLLICTKNGNAHPSEKLDSIIQAPVTKHSAKPEQVYSDIERVYDGPKIELFSRTARSGWTVWGNENV